MEETLRETNQVSIVGEIVTPFEFNHEVCGEKFYKFSIKADRLSGSFDVLPVLVSDRIVDVSQDMTGRKVKVGGRLHTHRLHEGEKSSLLITVFACDFAIADDEEEFFNTNVVFLDGYICKKPIYRTTPSGREITDFILAVNRPFGKASYIPCIAWGRNARFVDRFEIGQRLAVSGRFQSREYKKRLDDEHIETRTAYEVSVSQILVEEGNENEEV